jgi:hypothetical protein
MIKLKLTGAALMDEALPGFVSLWLVKHTNIQVQDYFALLDFPIKAPFLRRMGLFLLFHVPIHMTK